MAYINKKNNVKFPPVILHKKFFLLQNVILFYCLKLNFNIYKKYIFILFKLINLFL